MMEDDDVTKPSTRTNRRPPFPCFKAFDGFSPLIGCLTGEVGGQMKEDGGGGH